MCAFLLGQMRRSLKKIFLSLNRSLKKNSRDAVSNIGHFVHRLDYSLQEKCNTKMNLMTLRRV